jgi:hypothetical protein
MLLRTLSLLLLLPAIAVAAQTIPVVKVATPPVIDGAIHDAAWQQVKPIAIRDTVANVDILLRAVYSGDTVYFAVVYADQAQNSFHKPWIWDDNLKTYVEGAHREDTFVFKWNLENKEVDLSTFADNSYRSDVWYWKANRSNPAGYADDKIDILSDTPAKKSTEVISFTGKKRYLLRLGDQGSEAMKELPKPSALIKTLVDRYPAQKPSGSRADVRAKGVWNSGFWIIEFARKLQTDQEDDIQFSTKGGPYLFGVSIFSLYGNKIDKAQPNFYGMGEISEPLLLVFK